MINRIIVYIISFVCFLLISGIFINYYIEQPKKYPAEMCWKGRYLVRLGDEGSVYTRIKQFSCEKEGSIIILEHNN